MDDLAGRIRLLKKLTLKQRRILKLLLQDLTYPQIVAAAQKQWNWSITTDTIEYHVGQIFQKLGIKAQRDGSHRDELKQYGEVIKFLEEHRKPPPGMTQHDIQEVQVAPDEDDPEVPSEQSLALARQYEQETVVLQRAGLAVPPMVPAVIVKASPRDDQGGTVELVDSARIARYESQRTAPPPPSPQKGGWSTGQVAGAVVAAAVIVGLSVALIMALTRPQGATTTVVAPPTSAPVATPSSLAVSQAATPTQVPATATVVPPTSTPVLPTATPKPKPGDVLYEADWSGGMNGWAGAEGWQALNGMLIASRGGYVTAPAKPPIPDYAVEAEIQNLGESNTIGVFFRTKRNGGKYDGYLAGAQGRSAFISEGLPTSSVGTRGFSDDVGIGSRPFDMGSKWNTYRTEARGNVIQLIVNGAPLVEVTNNAFLEPGPLGIYCYGPCNVRRFKVTAL